MSGVETVRMMARYNAWADELIFAAAASLPAGEVTKERPNTLFKTILRTLSHNTVVDLIWKAHLEGVPHGFTARDVQLHDTLEALWEEQRTVNDWFVAWADAQTDASVDELVDFTFVSGEAGRMTRAEMVLHVVNHTSYHRGWVTDMFYQVPLKPPTTDLPVYLGTLRRAA